MPEDEFSPQGIPLFQSLSPDERAFLQEKVRLRSFSAGAHLLRQGEDSAGLFVVKSGLVGVTVAGDSGVERDMAPLGKGESVGEMSLLTGEPCSATVRALSETEAWFIERADFADLVATCPGLWRNLSHILSQRLVRTSRQMAANAAASVAAIVLVCPDEEGTALALAITASLARQTLKRTLLVDLRQDSPVREAGLTSAEAPGLGELLLDRSLLRAHESPAERDNGLWGARIADFAEGNGRTPAKEDALVAIEWLRPHYDHIILLCAGAPMGDLGALLGQARTLFLVAREGDVADLRPWLDRLSAIRGGRDDVDVAVLSSRHITSDNGVGGLWEVGTDGDGAVAAERLLRDRPGSKLRVLPSDDGLLRRMTRERVLLTEEQPRLPFSQAIARLARRIGGVQVGIALGAGMAKGFAHIGVLRILQESGVPVDFIAGSSIGSIVGSAYAGGGALEQIQRLMDGADRRIIRLTIPLKSLSSDRGLKRALLECHERAPTTHFRDLAIPFAAIATDVTTGRAVVLRDGLVWRAVKASISVPGIFPPTVIGNRVLVDGGLVNAVPTQTVREMGADIVIGVDLMSSGRGGPEIGTARARVPGLIEVLWRSMEIMLSEITARSGATADITLQPDVGRSRFSDFSQQGANFVAAGEKAAQDALPELRRFLPCVGHAPTTPGGNS